MTAKTNDIYNMALKLKQKGVIDGIGMQSHVGVNWPSFNDYKKALEKFLSTGLQVHISELDIASENNFGAQATYFKNIFQLAVDKAGGVTSLTVWGSNDGNSWIGDKKALLEIIIITTTIIKIFLLVLDIKLLTVIVVKLWVFKMIQLIMVLMSTNGVKMVIQVNYG